MILFNKSKIVIDAFINVETINDMFPIQASSNYFPDWWKSLPNSFTETDSNGFQSPQLPTIKRCDGVNRIYTTGFTIPLWADLLIETREDDTWYYQSSDSSLQLQVHNRIVYGNNFDRNMHFKILSPWIVKEKQGVNFVMTNCWWNSVDAEYFVPNGIMEFKYQSGSHINFFTKRKNSRFMINAGTPVCQLIPLTDKKVEIRTHVLDQLEYDRLYKEHTYQNSFIGKYKKKKAILSDKPSKCPFTGRFR